MYSFPRRPIPCRSTFIGRPLLARRRALTLALPLLAVAACSSGTSDTGPGDTFDRNALLGDVATNVIVPTLTSFHTAAGELATATAAWAAAESSGDGTAERQTARDAWRSAMAIWQRAEVMQIGPGGSPVTFTGGQALRDDIYAWPDGAQACPVDQVTAASTYDDLENKLVYAYGLAALEYLLFVPTTAHACGGGSINTTWSALTDEEITDRRAAYAEAAASKLATDADALLNAWTGGFADDLSNAGKSGSSFATAQGAVDELFAALFYVELRTKDRKLAIPGGIHASCASTTCDASKLESPWAQTARDNVLNNLAGARQVVLASLDTAGASTSTGFDDFLIDRDAQSTATDVLEGLSAAEARVGSKTTTFAEELAAQSTEVAEVHAAVKAFTDVLKSEMVTVLNLKVPDEGAGDND